MLHYDCYNHLTPRQRWAIAHRLSRLAEYDPGHDVVDDDPYADARRVYIPVPHVNPTWNFAIGVAHNLHRRCVSFLGRYKPAPMVSSLRKYHVLPLDRECWEVVGGKKVIIPNPWRKQELRELKDAMRVARQDRRHIYHFWPRSGLAAMEMRLMAARCVNTTDRLVATMRGEAA